MEYERLAFDSRMKAEAAAAKQKIIDETLQAATRLVAGMVTAQLEAIVWGCELLCVGSGSMTWPDRRRGAALNLKEIIPFRGEIGASS